MENLYAALSGHLLVGWWGTRLEPRQEIGAFRRVSPSFQRSRQFSLPNPRLFPRMADKVVSSVLAEALPLIAAKMRQFSGVTTHPVRE